jgi:hypothetical protein
MWVLFVFCIMQCVGIGSMAAFDKDNVSSVWGPMIVGLLGVGGVLLPSQIVFSGKRSPYSSSESLSNTICRSHLPRRVDWDKCGSFNRHPNDRTSCGQEYVLQHISLQGHDARNQRVEPLRRSGSPERLHQHRSHPRACQSIDSRTSAVLRR